MKSTRRLAPFALVAGALAMLAAGCGDGGPSTDEDAASTVPGDNGDEAAPDLPECPLDALDDADGPIEIDMWHTRGGIVNTVLENLVQEYNASQDRVVVTQSQQGTPIELDQKYQTGLQTGELPDIVEVPPESLRAFVDGGSLLPAESCFVAADYDMDQIVPAVRGAFTLDDVYWPGFVHSLAPVLYYNPDHFEAAGLDPADPPGTFDELVEAARTLKEAGVSPTPLAYGAVPNHVETWVTGAGEPILNAGNGRDGIADTSLFDNEATGAVYDFLAEMRDEELLAPFSVVGGKIDHYFSLLNQGSSMLVEVGSAGTSIQALLQGDLDPEAVGGEALTAPVTVAAAPMPGIDAPGQTFPGGAGEMIVNRSTPEEQAAAADFLLWWMEAEQGITWTSGSGGSPIVDGVADSPEVKAFFESGLGGEASGVMTTQILGFDSDLSGPTPGPSTQVAEAIRISLEELVLSGASPGDSLAKANEAIATALADYIGE